MTSSQTFTTGTVPANVTIAAIKAATERIAELQHDPLKTWMRMQGYDPDKGCFLALPDTAEYRDRVGPFRPNYVAFSRVISAPVLVNATHFLPSPAARDRWFSIMGMSV